MVFALPQRDHLGRRVLFYRPKAYNPSKNINHDIIRYNGVIFETLLEDEENQIRGVVHVVDGSGLSLNYITVLTPQQSYRICKNGEYMVPMRHKEFHGTAPHPALKFALDFGMSLMSDKLRSRVRLYNSFDDMKSIDRSLLPAEYGGKIPMSEMIDMFKKELVAARDTVLSHDTMEIRFEMYPEAVRLGSTRSLKTPLDSAPEAFETKKDMYGMNGLPGSFRKLEID